MDKKEFINFLNEIIKGFAFRKKGNHWYKDSGSIVKVVNAQKSNFGNQYYLNFGFIVKNVDLKDFEFHVSYYPIQMLNNELFDFDAKIPKKKRMSELGNYLNSVLERMDLIQSEDDLFKELKTRSNLNDIPLIVKEYFRLPLE